MSLLSFLTRNCSRLWWVPVLIALGCAGTVRTIDPELRLPFTVRVAKVSSPDGRAEAVSAEQALEPETPPVFADSAKLKAVFAESLRHAGLFTQVLTEEDPRMPADLVIEVEISGDDFGPGSAELGGAVFFMFVWLFAGHVSWFIENREYPQSNVRMNLAMDAIDETGDGYAIKKRVLSFPVPLNQLQLNFHDRADMSYRLMNIVIPPWWSDGDKERAGKSLAQKSLPYFAATECDRFLERFPENYYRRMLCYMVYDSQNDELVILSGYSIDSLTIGDSEGEIVTLDEIQMQRLAIDEDIDSAFTKELQSWFEDRAVGLVDEPDSEFFVVSLEKALEGSRAPDAGGLLRIEAQLAGGARARWTILRGEEPQQLGEVTVTSAR